MFIDWKVLFELVKIIYFNPWVITWSIIAVIVGVIYAYIIGKNSPPDNMTVYTVILGVGFTLIFEYVAMVPTNYAIMDAVGQGKIDPATLSGWEAAIVQGLTPLYFFMLTGLPMTIGQVLVFRKMKNDNGKAKK